MAGDDATRDCLMGPPEAERSTQMRWLADKRNACGDEVACLRKAYRKRLKYFEGPPHYTYSEHAE